MSKNWYPVIDYSKCAECGTCINKCKHEVYDKSKFPTPVVIYTEGCIEGCRGCSNICPNTTITYVGDMGSNYSGCSCGGNS